MNDKVLLLISIFISISLWLYVYSGENREIVIKVPVELIGVQDGAFAWYEPQEVSARVSGPQALLAQIGGDEGSTPLRINIGDMPIGATVIRLSNHDLELAGVEVLELNPARINIDIEKTLTKNLEVYPMILDEPADGYKIESVTVTPSLVMVEGAETDMALLDSVQTRHIDVTGRSEPFIVTTEFLEYDGVKAISPNTVEVKINIIKK
jgi:YbbR domain-containing protein